MPGFAIEIVDEELHAAGFEVVERDAAFIKFTAVPGGFWRDGRDGRLPRDRHRAKYPTSTMRMRIHATRCSRFMAFPYAGSPPVSLRNHRMHVCPKSAPGPNIMGQAPAITLMSCCRQYSTASGDTLEPFPSD